MIEKVIANLEEEIRKRDIPIRILRGFLRKIQRFDIKSNKTKKEVKNHRK